MHPEDVILLAVCGTPIVLLVGGILIAQSLAHIAIVTKDVQRACSRVEPADIYV